MERIPVSSTSLLSIGYDANSRILEVEFTRGAVYQYYDVPSDEYDSFIASNSKGQYFNSRIKNGYSCSQM